LSFTNLPFSGTWDDSGEWLDLSFKITDGTDEPLELYKKNSVTLDLQDPIKFNEVKRIQGCLGREEESTLEFLEFLLSFTLVKEGELARHVRIDYNKTDFMKLFGEDISNLIKRGETRWTEELEIRNTKKEEAKRKQEEEDNDRLVSPNALLVKRLTPIP